MIDDYILNLRREIFDYYVYGRVSDVNEYNIITAEDLSTKDSFEHIYGVSPIQSIFLKEVDKMMEDDSLINKVYNDLMGMTKDTLKLETHMNEITEEIFYDFLYMQNNIIDLIEEKTKELSIILHGRLPEGEMCDVDIWESEFKSRCIFVEFEEYKCGESWKDQFNLPMKFLYNKDYPAIYKEEYEERKRLKEETIKMNRLNKEKHEKHCLENFERDEYTRLRKKYE